MSLKLDGRLPAAEQRLLQAHVDSCAACAAHWAQLRDLDRLFAGTPPIEAPASLADRVLKRVENARLPRTVERGPIPLGVLLVLPVGMLLVGLAAMAYGATMEFIASPLSLAAALRVTGYLLHVAASRLDALSLSVWREVSSPAVLVSLLYVMVATAAVLCTRQAEQRRAL